MFKKTSKKFFVRLIFLTILVLSLITVLKKYFPNQFTYHFQSKSLNYATDIGNLKSCQIRRLDSLPESFSVVIGHAYGQNTSQDGYVASNILKFLKGNRNNIEKIVFTGDLFSVPSLHKWKRLFNEFKLMEIFIAPGNHDVLRPDSRDVFEASHFITQDYPYEAIIGGLNFVFDDSVVSKWLVDKKVQGQIADSKSQSIIVARHHVFIKELVTFANSQSTPTPLPSVDQFIKSFPSKKSVTWIMGDGGGNKSLPRLTCHSFGNHRFIINGIGEVENDTVLIIYEGDIFSYVI